MNVSISIASYNNYVDPWLCCDLYSYYKKYFE